MTLLTWSDDRVEMLKKLWGAGLSASQIAAELGGWGNSPDGGRNAVLGKVHRLGLSGRVKERNTRKSTYVRKTQPKVEAKHVPPRTLTAHAAEAPAELGVVQEVESFLTPICRIPLEELTDSNCHWPIGVPGDEDFCFCGNSAPSGQPYCIGHARLAYQPSAKRQRVAPGRIRSSSEIHFNRSL